MLGRARRWMWGLLRCGGWGGGRGRRIRAGWCWLMWVRWRVRGRGWWRRRGWGSRSSRSVVGRCWCRGWRGWWRRWWCRRRLGGGWGSAAGGRGTLGGWLGGGGVNFRDVMNGLGMYPGDAGLPGLEGAGVVLEVGSGVSGVVAGDVVMGLFTGAFGPVAVTDARLLAPVPAGGWGGGRVFGTASGGRRAAGGGLGVEGGHVASSRTTEFEAVFAAAAG